MTTSQTPAISIIGASGLDTSAIIDALAAVRRTPILRLEAQRARLQKQTSEFGTLRTRLDALRAKAAAIDTAAELRAVAASSSNSSAVTVVAGSSAAEGTYAVTVNTLAQAASQISAGFAEKSGLAIGSGIIQFDVNGVKHDVTIAAGSDLEAIRDAINAHEAPLTATIIDDGSPTDRYRLVVTSDTTGSAGSFAVNLAGFNQSAPLSFSQISAGQDASVTVNGVTVTRTTNSINDLVPGLTFNLLLEGGSSTVTVARDRDAVKGKIKDFVTAFNDVIDLFKAHSNAAAKDTTAVLYGDVTLSAANTAIRNVISSKVTGTGAAYDTLASIGIRTGSDGRLSVDDAALSAALDADYDGVIALFTQTSTGLANKAQSVTQLFQTNSLKSRTDGILARIRGINKQVDQLEDRLDKYIETLRKKFTALDQIAGRLQAQGSALSSIPS